MLVLHRYDAALKWNSALKIPDRQLRALSWLRKPVLHLEANDVPLITAGMMPTIKDSTNISSRWFELFISYHKNLTTKKYLVARVDNDQLTQGGIIESWQNPRNVNDTRSAASLEEYKLPACIKCQPGASDGDIREKNLLLSEIKISLTAKSPSRGHVHFWPGVEITSEFLAETEINSPRLSSCLLFTDLSQQQEIKSVSLEVIWRDLITIILMQIICRGNSPAVAVAK